MKYSFLSFDMRTLLRKKGLTMKQKKNFKFQELVGQKPISTHQG